jgi:hypothetical protein
MNYEQNAKVAFSTEGIAKLDQNIPNPFTANTVIKFFIPQNAGAGLIKIFSSDGSEIKSIPVSTKGSGQVEISGKTLQPGVYSYVLLLDGKFEVTRQMILTR